MHHMQFVRAIFSDGRLFEMDFELAPASLPLFKVFSETPIPLHSAPIFLLAEPSKHVSGRITCASVIQGMRGLIIRTMSYCRVP